MGIEGFEPSTYRLRADCSTTELNTLKKFYHKIYNSEKSI